LIENTPLPAVEVGVGILFLETNFFTFDHVKRRTIQDNRATRTKRNHATPSLNVWGSQECGTLLASSFSIRDLDPLVPELGSGVKLAGNTVGILTFCECGGVTRIRAVLQTVFFRIVHSDFTTSPWRQRLQVTQILFLEYLPWKN